MSGCKTFSFLKLLLAGLLFSGVLSGVSAAPKVPKDPLAERARSGNIAAQLALGKEYLFGENRPANPEAAAWWFHQAVRKGSAEAEYFLGIMYEQGWGKKKNLHAALAAYRHCSDCIPAAKLREINLIKQGIPQEVGEGKQTQEAIPANPAAALQSLRELALEKNYYPALLVLLQEYYAKFHKSPAAAVEVRRLAEQAIKSPDVPPETMLIAARLRLLGDGGPVDEAGARELLEQLAKQGFPPGQRELAALLRQSLKADERARAMELYAKAAEAGDADALVFRGRLLLAGDELPQDVSGAIACFQAAAKAGSGDALAELGECARLGFGLPRDAQAAFDYYEEGAKKGNPRCEYLLGCAYRDGLGETKDLTAAVFWFKCAGALNYVPAIRELGLAFWYGNGTAADPAEALRLLRAAAAAGDAKAASELKRLDKFTE